MFQVTLNKMYPCTFYCKIYVYLCNKYNAFIRRGAVMVHDTQFSKWIYIVKSVSKNLKLTLYQQFETNNSVEIFASNAVKHLFDNILLY